MLNLSTKAGLSGEFQVVVRRADGSVKFDSGMQPNLVLDNALKGIVVGETTFNNGLKKISERNEYDIFSKCVVGDGNTAPQPSDIALDNFVAANDGSLTIQEGKEEPSTGNHEGYVKCWTRQRFTFSNISNKNITEVGLVFFYGNYYDGTTTIRDLYLLGTRALIKDTSGTPISVSVKDGEVLEVTYQLNMYVDIRKQKGTFELTAIDGASETRQIFDYILQPIEVSGGSIRTLKSSRYYGVYDNTYGVKENDSELTASYDIEGGNFSGITHNTLGDFNKGISTKHSSQLTSYKDRTDSSWITEEKRSEGDLTISQSVTTGVYAHNHVNGIRAFDIVSFQRNNHDYICKLLVIVKNQDNGQGIKKTDKQQWTFNHTLTLSRWVD